MAPRRPPSRRPGGGGSPLRRSMVVGLPLLVVLVVVLNLNRKPARPLAPASPFGSWAKQDQHQVVLEDRGNGGSQQGAALSASDFASDLEKLVTGCGLQKQDLDRRREEALAQQAVRASAQQLQKDLSSWAAAPHSPPPPSAPPPSPYPPPPLLPSPPPPMPPPDSPPPPSPPPLPPSPPPLPPSPPPEPLPPPPPPLPPSPPPPTPRSPPPPAPPSVCVAEAPCGVNAECTPLRGRRYQCICVEGHRGNPYSSGPDKCRDEHTLYVEELFGLNHCYGCKYVPTLLGAFQRDTIRRVLDVGAGSCGVMRELAKYGLEVHGVEAVSFSLEDKCQDLLGQKLVQKAQLDKLPFEDNSFDLVIATHVLEFLPRDALPGVLAEMRRVSRLRVFVTVQLPDPKAKGLGAEVNGITLETVFPAGWWSEKLAANGLATMANRQKMMLAAYKSHKVRGASPQDGMFALAKEPAAGTVGAKVSAEPLCLACDYMPLAYHIYNPPGAIGELINHKLYHMGDVAVFSSTACNLIRGLEETRPSSLKTYTGYQLDPFTMERDCPELIYSGAVMAAPPPAVGLPQVSDDSLDLVMIMYHLEALSEEDARATLQEAMRITKRHVFVLVMTCGRTTLLPQCKARKHPWVRNVRSSAWWMKLFDEEGLAAEKLHHIFRERECLPEELTRKQPDRKFCPSWFEHFRFDGAAELEQANIFALEKKKLAPSIHQRPLPKNEPWALEAEAQRQFHPKIRGAFAPPPLFEPAQRPDPRAVRLPATRTAKGRLLRPPPPRMASAALGLGYSWKGVSQLTSKEVSLQEKQKRKAAAKEEAHRADLQLGKRQRPATGQQERLQDLKMELEGATEEHRQRRADRLDAAYRAKMVAQRGTDEELPVEEFLAKHGIQGGSVKAHGEILEQQRLEAMPMEQKMQMEKLQRAQGLSHKDFSKKSLEHEFGHVHDRNLPQGHAAYQPRGDRAGGAKLTGKHVAAG